jgi:hypothetical protein
MENYTILDQSIIDDLNEHPQEILLEIVAVCSLLEAGQLNFDSLDDLRDWAEDENFDNFRDLVSDQLASFINQGSQGDRLTLITVITDLINRQNDRLIDIQLNFIPDGIKLGMVKYRILSGIYQEQTNKAEMPLLYPELPPVDPALYNLSVYDLLQLAEAALYAEREGIIAVEILRAQSKIDGNIPEELLNFVAKGSQQNRFSIVGEIMKAITHKEPEIGGESVELKHFTNILPLAPEPDAHDLVYDQGEEM